MASDDVDTPPAVPISDGRSLQEFERFTRRLIGLARTRLDERLRHKIEPEDVVQSAYKSFFLRYGDGALAAEGWNGLWGLLTTITLRKCADRVRYFRAECRDLSREQGRPDFVDDTHLLRDALGREPTPEQAAALAETVEKLLSGLSDDVRPIVELSLQGYSTQEIGQLLGRAERSVRRIRERIRTQLEQANG